MTTIGILGTGGLAALMVRGVQGAGYRLILSPRNAEVSARLAAEHGCEVGVSNQAVVDAADGVFVSLPAATGAEELSGLAFRAGQPVLSAMAGTGLARLQSVIGPARASVSMMPGYANALGVGPSILCPDDDFWRPFLAATGPVHSFADEADFTKAATFGAFSGASFAWMAQVIAWYEAQGLSHDTARALVAATLRGNAQVLLSEDRPLAEIAREVITPGGISELLASTLGQRDALAAWDEGLKKVLRRIGG
ncbi:MAG TPA: pyrroline-5-carboxylate reductase dimerization domain-containing protein [Tabrizicola sp.]|nr:pyrroline-5-carboxylate reductase dimerization domain-containing protein [Tabrizicola sp.]